MASSTPTRAGAPGSPTPPASPGSTASGWSRPAPPCAASATGATAWGTSTAADGIALQGGTLAAGGISGTQGNWSWTTNIALANGTSSTIDNQLFSGTNRYLSLNGALSGSGDVTFASTGPATMGADYGFILAGPNTNSGLVTISPGAYVRVGGGGGTTATNAPGAFGSLGDGSSTNDVVNNGTLSFTRTDAITVPNDISGAGTVRVRSAGLAATSTQVVTLSGANTYTGATQVNAGRLNLTGSLTSDVSVAAGARIAGTGSSTKSLTTAAGAAVALAGGAATSSLAFNGVNIGGATAVVFDNVPVAATNYTVVTYGAGGVAGTENLSVQAHGALSDDGAGQKLVFAATGPASRTWNAAAGTWENGGTGTNWVEGDQKFYAGDSVTFADIGADAVVTLSGQLRPAAVTVANAADKHTFTGTAGTSEITGGAALTKTGAGTLAIATRQSYTGGTTVNGGVVDLTGGGGAVGAIRGTVTVNAGGTLRLSTGDATGYNTDATRVSTINLNGGTLDVNTTSNQTLGGAVVNMTGGSITGIAGSNIDFFANGSALNTFASVTSSLIATPTINLRQNDTVFDVADGAAAADLVISSAIGNGSTGSHNARGNVTVNEVLEGAGGLTKTGAGALLLGAPNTYTGPTAVDAGQLLVNGALAGSVGVGTGVGGPATLGGTGSVGGAIAVAGNGVLAPGAPDAVGTLTLTGAGNVTLDGKLLVDIDGTAAGAADLLTGAGTLDIGGGTVDFRALTGLDDPAYVFADYDTPVGSAFANVLNLPAGYDVDYNHGGGNQIALVNSVPEPAGLAAVLGLAAGALMTRRRRGK